MNFSYQKLQVLAVMLDAPRKRFYGYELMDATGLKSGSLYPMMARMVEEGLVITLKEKTWERSVGRPPRIYYKLTPEGRRYVKQALAQLPKR